MAHAGMSPQAPLPPPRAGSPKRYCVSAGIEDGEDLVRHGKWLPGFKHECDCAGKGEKVVNCVGVVAGGCESVTAVGIYGEGILAA
ncbi:hypothetical protein KCP77_00430 [Salmonella enterica subsp. enterica]|nr:hypothetical protein KCP77_00430 [Salmonella enterica subsp. enterica]